MPGDKNIENNNAADEAWLDEFLQDHLEPPENYGIENLVDAQNYSPYVRSAYQDLTWKLDQAGFDVVPILPQIQYLAKAVQAPFDIEQELLYGRNKIEFTIGFDNVFPAPRIREIYAKLYDGKGKLLSAHQFGSEITTKIGHDVLIYKYKQSLISSININNMNTQNLSYLQKNLLNLGFGDKLNEKLEESIKAKKPDFTLNTSQEYGKDKADYTLHFKRGDENEMYFFNKYDASLQGKDIQQTFFLNKGFGMTAKEAYNLMDGRAVHKQLTNLENEQYNAWVVLDKDNKNDYGNHKLKTFSEGWNYKPERALDKLDIVGINEPGERDKLMKSLEKGNRHQVTVVQDGKEVKISLEANPADHRVNIYNAKGIQQKLEDYKKPELKKETSQKQNQQSKEELPEKKSRKQGAKLKVQ